MNRPRFFALFLLTMFSCALRFLMPVFVPIAGIEPVTDSLLVATRYFSKLTCCLFVALQIVLFDALTSTIGIHTCGVVCAYFIIACISYYLREQTKSAGRRLALTVGLTVLFDALTGLTFGPLFFNQPFAVAVAGQIPVTFAHVAGNVVIMCVYFGAVYVAAKLKTKRRFWFGDYVQKRETGYGTKNA